VQFAIYRNIYHAGNVCDAQNANLTVKWTGRYTRRHNHQTR